ncbi:hypothetical protein AWENTII_006682 [Aspergillus wentii]
MIEKRGVVVQRTRKPRGAVASRIPNNNKRLVAVNQRGVFARGEMTMTLRIGSVPFNSWAQGSAVLHGQPPGHGIVHVRWSQRSGQMTKLDRRSRKKTKKRKRREKRRGGRERENGRETEWNMIQQRCKTTNRDRRELFSTVT